ncbi:MAG: Na+-dependent transporter [Planctomycetota bacterium]|nr:MAG: Na+-dependent transporter [Planctomycetota bacterium]
MSGATFSSRWALLFATLGMAIGTGNIWRFPRILSQNGGGTFLIPWLLFLFTWSIPLLMAEFALGRATRRGPIGAFTKVFGAHSAWRGGFVAICSIAILCYYSVVTGWTFHYLSLAATGALDNFTADNATERFTSFAESSTPLITHGLAIGLACFVVARGVSGGIERASKILIPALFGVLLLSMLRGLTLPGASDGLGFLTQVDWELLSHPEIWLDALSQSAWSTGAGWGLMLCYATYAGSNTRAGRESVSTGMGNNSASLLAALAILPAVFALAPLAGQDAQAIVQQSGPASTGLTFIWVPVLYQHVSWGGTVLGVIFFAGLAFAALSSLIALVELAVRSLSDIGIERRKGTLLVLLLGFLLGVPSALSLNVFANQDWVWGVGLIVSGGLLGYSVLRHGVARFQREHIEALEGGEVAPFSTKLFGVALRWLVLPQAIGLLVWWFVKAWDWTEGDGTLGTGERLAAWLNPFAAASVGTCLAQWALVIGLLLVWRKQLAARSSAVND